MSERFQLTSMDRWLVRRAVDESGLTQRVLAREARVGKSWLSMILPGASDDPSGIPDRSVRAEPLYQLLRVLLATHRRLGQQAKLVTSLQALVGQVAAQRGSKQTVGRTPVAGAPLPLGIAGLYVRRRDWDDRLEREVDLAPDVQVCLQGAPGTGKASGMAWMIKKLRDRDIKVASFVGGETIPPGRYVAPSDVFLALATTVLVQWQVKALSANDVTDASALAALLCQAADEVGPCVLILDKLERLGAPNLLTKGHQVLSWDGYQAVFLLARALATARAQGAAPPGLILCAEILADRQIELHRRMSPATMATLTAPNWSEDGVVEFVDRYIDLVDTTATWEPKQSERETMVSWLLFAFGGHPELTHRGLCELANNPLLRDRTLQDPKSLDDGWKEQFSHWLENPELDSTPGLLKQIVQEALKSTKSTEIWRTGSTLLAGNSLIRKKTSDIKYAATSAFAAWLVEHVEEPPKKRRGGAQ